MELFSMRTVDETKIRIMVRLVGDLKEGDSHYIQFFNILMRKALGRLGLELVGRNFYDAKAKVLHLSAYFFKSCNMAPLPRKSIVKPFTWINYCMSMLCAYYLSLKNYVLWKFQFVRF
jgi:hypothetical protein